MSSSILFQGQCEGQLRARGSVGTVSEDRRTVGRATALRCTTVVQYSYTKLQNDRRFAPELKRAPPSWYQSSTVTLLHYGVTF